MSPKQFRTSLLFLILCIVSLLLAGALVFSKVENWSFLDALYFATVTATTVGYGDLTPTHTLSKILTMVYALSIVPFVLYTFSLIAKFETERFYHQMQGLEKKQKKQEEEIEKTERKLGEQRTKIQAQEKEIAGQERKLKKQILVDRRQEKEIITAEQELGVVENIVGDVLTQRTRKKMSKK